MTSPIRNLPVALRFIFLFCLFIVCAGAFGTLAYLSIHGLFGVEKPEDVTAGKFTGPNDVNAFLYIQALYSIGAFMICSLLYARLVSTQPLAYLRLKQHAAVKWILLAAVAIIIAQFFIVFLVDVNTAIPLPPSMEFLREQQAQLEALTNSILSFTSIAQFLVVTLVIAIIPAIGEEMMFRGVILGDLLKAKVNPVLAIAFSGLCFALSHSQFNNVLAIFVLGSFLGYLYYTSGSLWVSIAAHFVNNFLTVLLKYLFNIGVLKSDWAEADAPLFATLISVVLFAGCIYIFNKWKQAYEPVSSVNDETESNPQSDSI